MAMNCKLEKFWNGSFMAWYESAGLMNCKLEKFWNSIAIVFEYINSNNEL